jgi:uncharacterized protein (DUF924 family)
VLAFWRNAGSAKWFAKDAAFDAEIAARFLSTYEAAAAGLLTAWEVTPDGALALVIVLDQFPRNMFRASARAADPLARAVAGRALARGFDQLIPASERMFFYLPFEHSEAITDQERATALFSSHGDEDLLRWAQLHADIMRRFGRFPHRNAMLGRVTTPEGHSSTPAALQGEETFILHGFCRIADKCPNHSAIIEPDRTPFRIDSCCCGFDLGCFAPTPAPVTALSHHRQELSEPLFRRTGHPI